MKTVEGKFTIAKVMIDEIDEGCLSQIQRMLNHEAFTNPVAIMPDTHVGKGSVIGFTMPLSEKTIPNVVGVDIGCGMTSYKSHHTKIDLHELDEQIKDLIPRGRNIYKAPVYSNIQPILSAATELFSRFVHSYNRKFSTQFSEHEYNQDWFDAMLKRISISEQTVLRSIGTLGGGNHFVELGKSQHAEQYYLTIHCGSRNLGLKVANYHQQMAVFQLNTYSEKSYKEQLEQIKSTYKNEPVKIGEKIKELTKMTFPTNIKELTHMEYVTGENARKYFIDMVFCQLYASANRKTIAERIYKKCFPGMEYESMETVHNYIDFNDLIIRKGAIRGYEGEKYIIPFNMEDGLIIAEGKSNSEWNYSLPHGAGRIHSRNQAKKLFDLEEQKANMKAKGVYTTTLNEHSLDECRGAYKNAEMIMDCISPNAKIVDIVKPILNVKDNSELGD